MNAPVQYAELAKNPALFLQVLWDMAGLKKVAPLNDVELDIFLFMVDPKQQHGKTRAVGAFRGVGKTTFGTSALTCYRLLRDPNREIIIGSKSQTEAVKTVTLIKSWLTSVPFLQHLAPNRLLKHRDKTNMIDVAPRRPGRQPSITAIGIEGQWAGNRAHTIIGDDIETDGNALTAEAREKLRAMTQDFPNILYAEGDAEIEKPIDPCEIVYVQTPKHEETILLDLKKRNYTVRSWPIAYPDADTNVINLAPLLAKRLESGKVKPGDPTVPQRFTKNDIALREAEGRTRFLRENMIVADLATTNRYPLRLADLIVMDVPRPPSKAPVTVTYGRTTSQGNGSTRPEGIECIGFDGDFLYGPAYIDTAYAPYTITKAALDPAGRGGDKTGLSIASTVGGLIYVHACLGLQGGASTAQLDEIATLLRDYHVSELLLETNNDDYGTYQTLLASSLNRLTLEPGQSPTHPSGWRCAIRGYHSTVQKELRILRTLEPVMGAHRLIVDRTVVSDRHEDTAFNRFQYQLTRITKDRKCLPEDGKLDSLAAIVAELSPIALPRKTDDSALSALEAHEANLLARQRAHFAALRGRSPTQANAFRR